MSSKQIKPDPCIKCISKDKDSPEKCRKCEHEIRFLQEQSK